MRVWGLTGGIGAGKSEAARVLRSLGVPVLDADRIARDQMQPGTAVFDAVVAEFGTGILGPAGAIDRTALAAIVFADAARRARLDVLTHGPVMDALQRRLSALGKTGHPLAFVEAALVFETGLDRMLSGTVAVLAPIDVRIARVQARDQVVAAAVQARIAAQMDDEARRARATRVVENSGDLNALRGEVVALLVTMLAAA
jgi:dephospho-CoA kinase